MPGLVPGIHVFAAVKTWMAGTSPAMTNMKIVAHRSVRNSAGRAAPAHASRGAKAEAATVKSAMPKLVVAECAALFRPTRSLHVMPGLRTVGQAAPSPRHARACPGHPRLRRGQDVDGRDGPGHDEHEDRRASIRPQLSPSGGSGSRLARGAKAEAVSRHGEIGDAETSCGGMRCAIPPCARW